MKVELLDFKELENYPACSGIEFYDDKIYLVGEAATELLVMNKKWKKPGYIPLFAPIPKKSADAVMNGLEAMTLLSVDKKPQLLIIGSGTKYSRSQAVLLNLKTKVPAFLDLGVFYERIKALGLTDLNIEGIAQVYDYLVLVHGGNHSNPDNYLIITTPDFWNNQKSATIQTVKIDFDPKAPKGMYISGISYSDNHEDLFMTIHSATGEGKSWLGIIENMYRKIGREKITMRINQLVDLPAADSRFAGYTFEAVCIQSEKDHSMKLHFVADNTAGKSFLFKVELRDMKG